MSGIHLSGSVFPIYRQETVSNYLHNLLTIAGGSDAATLNKAVGFDVRRSSPLLPSRLQALRDEIGDSLPPLPELVQHNTILPALRLTLGSSDYEKVLEHTINEPIRTISATAGVMCKVKNRASQVAQPAWSVAVCPECFNDDLHTKGRTFLRRAWMFSSLAICSQHRIPLLSACVSCRERVTLRNWAHRVDLRCPCGYGLTSRVDSKDTRVISAEIRISEAFDFLFSLAGDAALDSRNTLSVLTNRAATLGLIDGHVHWSRLERLLHTKLDAGALSRHGISLKKGVLGEFLQGSRLLRNPLHNALLIAAFYDSPEEFGHEMAQSKTLVALKPGNTNVVAPPSTNSREVHIARHLQTLVDFVKEHPGASRTEIRRRIPTSVFVLEHFAPKLSEPYLPPIRSGQIRQWSSRNHASGPNVIDHYSKVLMDFVAKYPGATRTQIREKFGAMIEILTQFAPAVAEQYLPPSRYKNPPGQKLDYGAYDRSFAAEVRQRRSDFEVDPPPFRISKACLIVGFKNYRSIYTKPHRLPLTIAALDESVETFEEYGKRKVTGKWVWTAASTGEIE